MQQLTLEGTDFEVGYEHGRKLRDSARECVEKRLRLCEEFPDSQGRLHSRKDILNLARSCIEANRSFDEALWREFEGIAEGAGISTEALLIGNGYTDFKDLLWDDTGEEKDAGGCTTFIVSAEEARDQKPLIGQTWDLHSSMIPHVVLVTLRAGNAPRVITFTVAGCVGMIGMNEHGVCVGINNLNSKRGVAGVFWPFVVRRMLREESADGALAILRNAPLAGAHNYVILDPANNAYNVEQLPDAFRVDRIDGRWAHSNHCLFEETAAYERPPEALPKLSTHIRLRQARTLLHASGDPLSLDALEDISCHEDPSEPYSICVRPKPEHPVATCGACFMSPADLTVRAVAGIPADNRYVTARL